MINRREFLQSTSAGAALLASSSTAFSAPLAPRRDFEHGDPLNEFDYSEVSFRDGVHQRQLEQTHSILMGMDEDSLLRPFRLAAGLPAPGWDLNGWYSATPEMKAGPSGPETFGQWISALSRYYAITKDEDTRRKVERLIDGYAKTVEPEGKVFQRGGNPSYHYDKLICGLEDAYEFAGVKPALGLISATTAAALPHLAGKAIDPLGPNGEKSSEGYTVPEVQFIAWQRGAGPRQLEMAKQYLADDFYFDPLARGENVLAGRHAYSHVLALSSAAKAYLVLGDEKYLRAARNGFSFLEAQSYATGAWGCDETLLPAQKTIIGGTQVDSLGDALKLSHHHFETPCGSYAHFKLTRYLLRITKDSRYGDSMERVMYNTVLGALPLNKFGKAFYQSNYHAHAHKAYFDGYDHLIRDEWPCCSGSLPQVAADYRISAYFRDAQGVYVNLYIPSSVRWSQGGADVSLSQSGSYPLGDRVTFEVQASKATAFALRLRIPAWAKSPSVRINGQALSEPVRPGAFTSIRRKWRSGDRIELDLPRELTLQAVDSQHPDMVALVHGPLVLFAVSDDTPKVTRQQLLAAKQRTPGSEEWWADSSDGPLRFLPWWLIKDETYFTYLTVAA